MKKHLLFQAAAVLALLTLASGASQAALIWDFWDGAANDNGWTTILGYETPPRAGYTSNDGGGVGPTGPSTYGGDRAWNNVHPNFLFESPAFNFDGSTLDGTNVLQIVSSGGSGQQGGSVAPYANPAAIPTGNSTSSGLKGWAFLNTASGQYDATFFKPNNNTGDVMNLTAAQLTAAGMDLGNQYKMHFYETDDGSWGWTQLNGVSIAGNTGPVTLHVGGDGTIGTESLTGTQSNAVTGGGVLGAKTIRVVQNVNDSFQVAELQIFSGTTNVALTGSASAKDNYQNNTSLPGRTNDGNTSGQWSDNSVWHSSTNAGTWLQIDLASDTDLDAVHFWGRTDCCQGRQDDFNLIIEDASGNVLYNEQHTGIGTSPDRNARIPLSSIVSADLMAALNPHDFGAGYTYAFELGGDMLSVENPDENIFTTHLDINDAAFTVDWLGGSAPSDLAAGDSFQLLDADVIEGIYESLILPALPAGMEWDLDAFLTSGTITAAAVPEPSTFALAGLGLLGMAAFLRRRKR